MTWYLDNFYLRGRKIKAILELLVKKHILDRRGGHLVTLVLQSVLASVARSDHCLCTMCVYILFINHSVCYVQWGHLNSQDSFSLSSYATGWIHLLRISIVQR